MKELPNTLTKLPVAPKGYHWVYRGKYWKSDAARYIFHYLEETGRSGWVGMNSVMDIYKAGGNDLHYVELVKGEPKCETIEEQITKAKSLVGKKVVGDKGEVVSVKGWDIVKGGVTASLVVEREANEKGYCVFVRTTNYQALPVNSVEEFVEPTEVEVEVKLNGAYTATVSKDTIKVGCQTFPISILDDLLKAKQSLS